MLGEYLGLPSKDVLKVLTLDAALRASTQGCIRFGRVREVGIGQGRETEEGREGEGESAEQWARERRCARAVR